MPEPAVSSWADEIEEGDSSTLPPPSEKIKGDTKVVTEYMFNDDGKKVKVVRTYKIEKKMVPKSVAQRRSWAKFGMSKSDKPGPNPQVNCYVLPLYGTSHLYLISLFHHVRK